MSPSADQKNFEENFKAQDYLRTYFSDADLDMVRNYVLETTQAEETMRIMMFADLVCSPLIHAVFGEKKITLLELGGGPTLYQLMNIVHDVEEIHFCDLLEENLDEIRKWQSNDPEAFDWNGYLEAAVMLKKDSTEYTQEEVTELKETLQNKITKIMQCDVFERGFNLEKDKYDIISTHFVAESATSSKNEWQESLVNMFEKLENRGLLFMSALRGAKGSYHVQNKEFPAVELYENDLQDGLKKAGFSVIRVSKIHTEARGSNYEGFMFAVAQKRESE